MTETYDLHFGGIRTGLAPWLCDACARPVEAKTVERGENGSMDRAVRNLPCGCHADAVSMGVK